MTENVDVKKPPQGRLGWIDRLLLKIAVAAALAKFGENFTKSFDEARAAFDQINQGFSLANVADHDSCEKSTQQALDATAAKLQLLLVEARRLASLSSRLFVEIAPERYSTKDLPEACEEHQSSPCATCCHFEKRY